MQLFFVMKNTVHKAIFGLKTYTTVSTRDPKCLKRHFWISGTFFFLSEVSDLGLLDLTSAPCTYYILLVLQSCRPKFGHF